MTDFETRCFILAELWTDHRNNNKFSDFFDYNDIALPLAFMIDQKIVEANEVGIRYIDETWELLCEALSIEDTGFDDLSQMLSIAEDDDADYE